MKEETNTGRPFWLRLVKTTPFTTDDDNSPGDNTTKREANILIHTFNIKTTQIFDRFNK